MPFSSKDQSLCINRWYIALILIVSFSFGLVLYSHQGIQAHLGYDGPEYLAMGESLAAGQGLYDATGFWPNVPQTKRLPGWPALLAPILWITPQSWHTLADRLFALLILSLTGVVFYLLCLHFGVSQRLAALSGLFAGCSVPIVALAYDGMSDGAAVFLVATGIWLVLRGGRWRYAGAVCFGAASMVRGNLVLLPVFVAIGCALSRSGRSLLWSERKQLLAAIVIVFSFPALWMIRNYTITHRAFLLSSEDGETMYGGNNDAVANQLEAWGYWVEPDSLEGELPEREVARTLTAVQMNDYYRAKAISWIKSHRSGLPRLWLGKLIRGFVPLPWHPLTASYVASAYRLVLDILFLVLISRWWPRLNPQYGIILGSLFLTSLITVVIYCGVYRFAHCSVELFFIPLISAGFESRRPSLGVSKPLQDAFADH
jgi:hypothetical protein